MRYVCICGDHRGYGDTAGDAWREIRRRIDSGEIAEFDAESIEIRESGEE